MPSFRSHCAVILNVRLSRAEINLLLFLNGEAMQMGLAPVESLEWLRCNGLARDHHITEKGRKWLEGYHAMERDNLPVGDITDGDMMGFILRTIFIGAVIVGVTVTALMAVREWI